MIGPWKRAIEAEGQRTVAQARVSSLEGHLAEAHTVIRDLTQMVRDQTTQIMTLKREGFQPPVPVYTETPEPDFDGQVLEAMYEQAKPGDALWSQLASEVRTMQGRISPEEIAKRIRSGEDFDWSDMG